MVNKKLYDRAEKKVDLKIKFYYHLFSYLGVNLILLIINLIFTPNEWWVLGVSLFWGVGVLFHFLKVFLIYDKFDEVYRENMIKKELEKMG